MRSNAHEQLLYFLLSDLWTPADIKNQVLLQRRKKVPQTIEWGLTKNILNGVIITSFIFITSVYMPLVGFFGIIFLPLPITFYRLKLGRSNGAIIPAAAIIVMAIMIGKVSIGLLFYVELLLLGFVLGELIELDLSIEKTILYTCYSVIFSAVFCLLIYSSTSNAGIFTMASKYVAKNLELIVELYREIGIPEEDIQAISNSMDRIQYYFVRIIPALAIASTLIIVWANILLAKPLLNAKKITYPNFRPLKTWKAPDILVWGLIICGLLCILPPKALKVIGLNGVIILLPIYLFQGIAIVSFYFEKKQFPRLLRFIIYSLIALQQIVLLIVIVFGLFDMWFDFRKLETKINNQEN
jgi:uncharacterized protein YybS (DUF2232 family)